MYEYDEEVLEAFLAKQGQLFSENVADTLEEAEAFLEDCMAVVCDDFQQVKDYFEEEGVDILDMTDEEIKEQCEVFELPHGRYLIVEG